MFEIFIFSVAQSTQFKAMQSAVSKDWLVFHSVSENVRKA